MAPKTPTRAIIVPSLPACLLLPEAAPAFSGGDSAAGEEAEDGEEQLSETDLVDPQDEYTEVEKLVFGRLPNPLSISFVIVPNMSFVIRVSVGS